MRRTSNDSDGLPSSFDIVTVPRNSADLLIHVIGKRVERFAPEVRILIKLSLRALQRFGTQRTNACPTSVVSIDQLSLLQCFQMLGHSVQRHVKGFGQRGDLLWCLGQAINQGASSGIRQRMKDAVQPFLRIGGLQSPLYFSSCSILNYFIEYSITMERREAICKEERMSTEIQQEIVLNASQDEVYRAFMDEKTHAAVTGGVSNVDQQVGGPCRNA